MRLLAAGSETGTPRITFRKTAIISGKTYRQKKRFRNNVRRKIRWLQEERPWKAPSRYRRFASRSCKMVSGLQNLTSRRKLVTQVLRLMIALLIFLRCNRSAGTVLSWAVRPCRDDCGPNVRNDKRSLKLLFLSIHEFRGEQYAFQDLAVESFEINPVVQQQLLKSIYPGVFSNKQFFKFVGSVNPSVVKYRRDLLKEVLEAFYRQFPVDVVIGHDHRVWFNFDWGEKSEDLGIPYAIIYRETALYDQGAFDESVRRHRTLPRFNGSAILVANEVGRKMFSMTETVPMNKVHIVGNPRMDRFVKKIKDPKFSQVTDTGAVLFSAIFRCWISGGNGWEFTDRMHVGFAEVAARNPQSLFTMKFKPGHQSSDYVSHLVNLLKRRRLYPLPNLHLEFETPAADLILGARVVVGILSTTLLESCVAAKNVIVPAFREYQQSPDWADYGLREYLHLFTVVETDEEYVQAIENGLDSSIKPSSSIMEGREALFTEYVSNLHGSAAKQAAKVLSGLVHHSDLTA